MAFKKIYKHKKLEKMHIKSSESLKDFVIGMADGLTVPFALVSGLSGVLGSTNVITVAGIAEIAAGTVAMALGGYLAARTEADHYQSELEKEQVEIMDFPEEELKEVEIILQDFGLTLVQSEKVALELQKNPEKWVDFMMRFELGLNKPDSSRIYKSPLIIGAAYTIGGMIPLMPYFMTIDIDLAFNCSVTVTLIALLGFGAFKGAFSGVSMFKSAITTCSIGGTAAASAFFFARLFS